MNNANAVHYTRAALQSEQGLKDQLEACREFSAHNGFDVVGEYSDVGSGVSGQPADLQRMIEETSEKGVRYVVVQKFDRLSRDSGSFMLLKNTLKQRGIDLLSVTEGTTDSPEIIILESILDAAAKGAEEH